MYALHTHDSGMNIELNFIIQLHWKKSQKFNFLNSYLSGSIQHGQRKKSYRGKS